MQCPYSQLAFDPAPFIRTFEASLAKLMVMRKELQSKTEQMEKNVRVAEREYSKKMSDLNKGFEVNTGVCVLYRGTDVSVSGCRSILHQHGV